MKTYLTAFYRAIFSPPLYADIIQRWKGIGVLYLLLLSFVVGVILCGRLLFVLNTVAQDDVSYILDQIPEITIEKGEATTDVEKPYDVVLQNGQTILRILEQVNLNTVEEENAGVPAILGPKNIILIRPEGSGQKMRVHSLSKTDNLIINRDFIQNIWDSGRVVAPFLAWPFVSLGLFISYFLRALVVALISYIVTAFMKEEYVFETRLRMSMVALTPVILVNQISEIVLSHKLHPMIMIAMATLYIYVMVKTARQVK